MANDDQPKGDPEFQEDLDEVLGTANPNPSRVGCLSPKILSELAGRNQPLGDPAYEHLLTCSECYREFRRLQNQKHGVRRES
ncbi:MAG: hypothetical protein WC815_17420 [Vicinamibacterales bacterium]|jgi:hypothetical protein